MSENESRNLGDVCVLGLGKTGEAVAEYLLGLREDGRVGSVTVYGGLKSEPSDATRALEAEGAKVIFGTESVEGHYDLAVSSPGISEFSDFYASAAAAASEVIGEPELAWRESPERWVGITGTNGKTTTTTLTRDLLRAGGRCAEAVGNIGTMCVGEVARRAPGEWLVAELSSFQLATSKELRPHVAVLLNVTPDHLYWHNTMENYAAAKEKVFANLGEGDLAVISDGDSWCRDIAKRVSARGIRVCRLLGAGELPRADEACAAWEAADGMLVVRIDGADIRLVNKSQLSIFGEHNVENALAASAAVLACGVSAADVREGLVSFAPLEHRIEPCGEMGGVRFVNDSKATNTDAVSKALTAFEPGSVIILLGGHDKGTDLAEMAADVASCARVAVCFGEAGERIAASVREAGGKVELAEHLEQALDASIALAHEGDVVLLSPACSSFDEFSGFEERGRVFKALVANRIAAGE
jgi:UDP-N-acetylmuramoylalanine--D-glutamate ligase